MADLHRTTGRWRLGLALTLLTTLLWGTLPVALKFLLGDMSPLTVTWFRYLVSVALLTGFLVLRGALPRPVDFRPHAPLLGLAALAFVGNNVFYLAGLRYVTPSVGQIVIQLAPVLLIAAGVAVFGEAFGWLQWCGFAVLVAGMLLFFHRNLAGIFSAGVLLIVFAAALWTIYAMAQKQLMRSLTPFAIMWAAYLLGFILLAPAASPSQAASLDAAGWIVLAYCCLNGLIGYGSFAEAMSHWEMSRVSAVLATTPLYTPVFAELAARVWPGRFAHEGLDWLQLFGGALVALGSMLAALSRKPAAASGR